MNARNFLSALVAGVLMVLSLALSTAGPGYAKTPVRVGDLLAAKAGLPLPKAIEVVSSRLLGARYVDAPLGEGEGGDYDRLSRWRLDVFDCVTFVETTLALALSSTEPEFRTELDRIRYQGGKVSYLTRNHFTELDWIPSNAAAGFVRDITAQVGAAAGPDAVQVSRAWIDKPQWYASRTAADLHLPGVDARAQALALAKLRAEGSRFKKARAALPYLPIGILLGQAGGPPPRPDLLDRIPSGAVISIVREWWTPVGSGTRKIVSHMGFAIRHDGVLYFRNASALGRHRRVVDEPLLEYLARYRDYPTIRGINILEVTPRLREPDHRYDSASRKHAGRRRLPFDPSGTRIS